MCWYDISMQNTHLKPTVSVFRRENWGLDTYTQQQAHFQAWNVMELLDDTWRTSVLINWSRYDTHAAKPRLTQTNNNAPGEVAGTIVYSATYCTSVSYTDCVALQPLTLWAQSSQCINPVISHQFIDTQSPSINFSLLYFWYFLCLSQGHTLIAPGIKPFVKGMSSGSDEHLFPLATDEHLFPLATSLMWAEFICRVTLLSERQLRLKPVYEVTLRDCHMRGNVWKTGRDIQLWHPTRTSDLWFRNKFKHDAYFH